MGIQPLSVSVLFLVPESKLPNFHIVSQFPLIFANEEVVYACGFLPRQELES